ncbi:MAG TPA: glycosyltransferase family 2 protein [Kiritimatiellia bacterium]|nr:glycosyltransferase family 2 protein [Kiritimatiellia bacterium]
MAERPRLHTLNKTMRPRITACVTTYNEERNIRRCLDSLAWCDEIVVVDSFSTDATVEICRTYTDRVVQHEWLGYIGQKNLIRKMATHDWLLFVDADEEVSAGLRAEILNTFEGKDDHVYGYEFPRMVYYLGKWIRYGEWYPDIKLRLFHRDHGRSGGQEPHDQVFVTGEVKRLKGVLYHYTYDDIRDHLETVNRFSSITAHEKFKEGERFRWMDFLLRPKIRFFKGYVVKRGFLDGFHGLLIALVSSFGVYVKYAKLWELAFQQRQVRAAGQEGGGAR